MQLFINFILSAGIIILIVLVGLLFKNKENKLPSQLLIIIFSSFFFIIIYSFGEYNKVFWMYYIGFPIADSIGFLVGPLLYFYLLSLFKPEHIKTKKALLHFIIFTIYLTTVSIPFLITFIKDNYIFSYLAFIDKNEYLLHIQALYLLGYAFATLLKLIHFNKELKNHYSNLEKKDFSWIYFLLIGVIFLMMLDLISEIHFYITGSLMLYGNEWITILMILLVFWLAYFGTNQSTILLPKFKEEGSFEKSSNKNKARHHLTNTSEEDIKALELRLKEVLETLQPYKDEDLTLASFASLLPTTDRKLSALLNHYLNTTFYDLINAYRVSYVKQKLIEPESHKYTILAIAYEAGFSSKTSFNRIFKKETKLSPSAYKKQYAIK